MSRSKRKDKAEVANEDPLTGAPGAHPVGVALGATGGAAAGAAVGRWEPRWEPPSAGSPAAWPARERPRP